MVCAQCTQYDMYFLFWLSVYSRQGGGTPPPHFIERYPLREYFYILRQKIPPGFISYNKSWLMRCVTVKTNSVTSRLPRLNQYLTKPRIECLLKDKTQCHRVRMEMGKTEFQDNSRTFFKDSISSQFCIKQCEKCTFSSQKRPSEKAH